MIITIQDAPKMKNIQLNISFEDDGSETVQVIQNSKSSDSIVSSNKPSQKEVFKDSVLDLDEDFEIQEEIIEKPVIEETEREVLVSTDMQSATF